MLWSIPCAYILEHLYFYRMDSQKWDCWSEVTCILHFDRCHQIIFKKVVPIYVPKKCINLPFPAPSPNRMLLIFWFLSIQWLKKEISFQLVFTRVWRSFAMFLGYILSSMHCLLRSFSQSFTKLLVFPCWFIVLPLGAY